MVLFEVRLLGRMLNPILMGRSMMTTIRSRAQGLVALYILSRLSKTEFNVCSNGNI
jgi:hypothetical protein